MPPPITDQNELKLSQPSFDKIKRLIYDKAGIDLQNGKEQLVAARLAKLVRAHHFQSYDQYLDFVAADRSTNSLIELVDALTTNFTSFLREPAHFEFMQRIIFPALASRPQIKIWCAAAATGEEPYSLLFSALENLAGSGRSCQILATDISTKALATARQGVYPADRFSPVPKDWLPKYLLRGSGDAAGLYRVKPDLQKLMEFKQLNLIEPYNLNGQFPLISCRNVMIYFDKPTQQKVVDRLVMHLEPGGYLFIGHSDGLTGITHKLTFVQPAIFQKPGAPGGLK